MKLSSLFSSKSFTVSGLTFKALLCFELIFCVWYKISVHFHFFQCEYPVFPFVEETIPASFFFLKIVLVIHGFSWSHMKF